jgi:hypothetical protein
MTETRRVTYTGPASRASFLVQLLEEEGVTVDWTPPLEKKDFGSAFEAVVVGLITTGSAAAIKAAVAAFRQHQADAKVEIEDEDDD